jgi:hypothetical protein
LFRGFVRAALNYSNQ